MDGRTGQGCGRTTAEQQIIAKLRGTVPKLAVMAASEELV